MAQPTGDGWLQLPEQGDHIHAHLSDTDTIHRLLLMSGSMSEPSLAKVAGVKKKL